MKPVKIVLLGCGAFLVLALVVLAAIGVFIWHSSQDPQGVAVTVEGPDTVKVSEEFTMSVLVHNQRTKKESRLTDVDLDEKFLQGFLVLGTEPAAKSSMHVPIDNKRSYTLGRPVRPGEKARFTFRLRSIKAGLYRGDVDVCEGTRFLSAQLQTLVEEAR